MKKRYQYFTSTGKAWTKWFYVKDTAPKEKYQLKGKLLNEYKND